GAPGPEVTKPAVIQKLDQASHRAERWLGGIVGQSRATVLLLVMLAIVVKNVFTFLSRYAVAQLGLATIRDLRDRVFDALLTQSPRFFHETPSGVIIARVVNDVRLIHEALAERFADLLQDSLTVVALLVYVFSLNFKLALATLVLAPVLLAPVIHFSRRLRRRSQQSQERMGDLTAILNETVKGIRVVQAFGMETFEARRFRQATHRHFWSNLKARVIQAANAPVMEIVGSLGALALIGYASSQIASGALTLGDFSAFLLGVYGAYNPVKRLNNFNLALQQAVVASRRVFEIIDAPVEIREREGATALSGIGEGVHLDHVWFSYGDERWVLSDLELRVPAGATVALVGASGAGKTTVAQLVPRFWDVQTGAVRVGGVDVRDLTLSSLRGHIGLVTQETILFNDTVRANIAFGLENPSQERIEAAARAAFAHEFVLELPHGYDTVIGESGLRLSGGQRQRLAVARALFKDPPILILDEATSALDPEAEMLVQRALENLMRGRTTLVIAHRLTTVRSADTIVVLEQGRVAEQGDHRELMTAGGPYAKLVEMQELVGEEERS
ncbi:MAG: ABC transporter ATP-binding protein/permease, partial [Acidobacteria bacterium]|nr:ABC transporter ATP-binding protein/permease [Acidobacteriota bacterium]